MSYKRPSNEKLDEALVNVLLRCQTIESQSELVRLVVKELEKDGINIEPITDGEEVTADDLPFK